MTLRSVVALTKRVPAGHGVSYGLTYRTAGPTGLALIGVGYGDGIPRHASSVGQVAIRGRRYRIAGRVAMDQVVVDIGDDDITAGDPVTVFGPGDTGGADRRRLGGVLRNNRLRDSHPDRSASSSSLPWSSVTGRPRHE